MAKSKSESAADEKIVTEAHKRFARCEDRESETRPLWKADLRFANGDPENGWQWDDSMRMARNESKRPCLTINKVKQHNRQITNDARQNKPAVRVLPVDDGADKEAAEVFNGIIRHIEANSGADVAYDTAAEFAVDAGLGYWRVTTDYAADDTFDQEIFIKAVKNPLNVYLDPDIQEADGSDARYGFVFEDMTKEEFEAKYPDFDAIGWPSQGGSAWLASDMIRIAEYFKKTEVKDTLYADENGNTILASKMEADMKAAAKQMGLKSRQVMRNEVKWFLIAGDQILDQKDWPGIYIPIVRVVGEEVEIEGKVHRKGHTRAMKDAQRMYNYNSSAAIEYGALQTKTPWVAPAEAIAGYEGFWNGANTENRAYLPYNHVGEDGTPIPGPNRTAPPAASMLFIEGMRTASEEMKMASGQYDASMGAKSNETSGRAIMARQREGDTATFHFIDNVARAIKYTGKILVDLIPKVYDTPRVVRILGEDGAEDKAHLDPSQPQAYTKQQGEEGIQEIFNPTVGRYDVTVSVGPSYGSKRQEAFQALTEMGARNPQLMQVAGDLVMKAADFPMADQIAERLKKALPPGLADDGNNAKPPELAQAEQQIQQLNGQLQALGEEFNQMHEGKEIERDKLKIDAYARTTERLKVIAPFLTPEMAMQLADNIGLNVANDPDPADMIGYEPAPPPGMQPTEETSEPAQAGFLTPEAGQ